MSQHDTYDLLAKNFFKNPKLPLRIWMHEYKSSMAPWHRHKDFHELVLVCSGHASNETSRGCTLLSGGNVLFFPPGSVHRYKEMSSFWHYNILFDASLLQEHILQLRRLPTYGLLFETESDKQQPACSPLLDVSPEVLRRLIEQLEQMRNEEAVGAQGWETEVYFRFLYFIAYLLRNCSLQSKSPDSHIEQITRVVRLMERDSRQPYNLKLLAAELHMSESSFRQHFKAVTGFAVLDYLIRLRIKKSLFLLCSSNSVSRVAEQSGFPDSNYFTRQFSKLTGLSPSQFQRQYQQYPALLHEIAKRLLLSKSAD